MWYYIYNEIISLLMKYSVCNERGIIVKKWNYIISVITACLGTLIIYESSKLSLKYTVSGPGAGVWPMMLGGLLLLCALALFIATFINKEKYEKLEVILNTAANKRVYIVMAAIVLYCILLKVAGFYLATALVIPVLMYIMGERRIKRILCTMVFGVIGIYLIFDVLLHTKLPVSIFL